MECGQHEKCENRECVDPCDLFQDCEKAKNGSICEVRSRQPYCKGNLKTSLI